MSNRRSRYLLTLLLVFPLLLHAEDAEYQEGFLTTFVNRAISASMADPAVPEPERLRYGRDISAYMSAPVFGGYINGKYSYTDRKDASVSNSFDCRLIRAYVSGSVLRDFRYRVQLELRNTPAMRDYTLEWVRWKEFQIKVGQFKRCFTFENPASPWDIGFGGYSQMVMHMTAFGQEDPSGERSQNGRDQGIQLSGSLFPVSPDRYRLVHYQLAMYNGSGQNQADNDSKKDWIGNVQVQPLKGLFLALFGWTGSHTQVFSQTVSGGQEPTAKPLPVTVRRQRWGAGIKYDSRAWSARAEYAHHSGCNVNDFLVREMAWKQGAPNHADGWYASLGIPMTHWLKTYVKYDVYRQDATWNTARTVYSICPNVQLHKNLMFQLQYNFVNDKTHPADRYYHEIWAESYVRF